MTTYVKFTEHNEQEGETWHFWIPLDGSEATLAELKLALNERDPEGEEYDLDLSQSLSETEVDVLLRYGGDTNYMAAHNKLSGVLVFTPAAIARIKDPEDDPFYKGGIRQFVRNGIVDSPLQEHA